MPLNILVFYKIFIAFIYSFIAAKDYENAAAVLGKRKDPKSWKLGALLAKEAGDTSLCMSLASECLYISLVDEDWSTPKDIIKEHPSLEVKK